MSFRRALLATTLLAVPAVAGAQPLSGLYVGAGGGYNFEEARGLRREVGVAIPGTRAARFDDGYVGVLSLGYGFGNGWRTEVEGDFRENDVLRRRGVAGAGGTARGRQRLYGGMVNALFDFDFSAFGIPPSVASPYIGGGLGGMNADFQRVRLPTGAGPAGSSVLLNEQRTDFAYQGIAGVAFPIGALPGLALTAEYRYLGTVRPDVTTRLIGPTGAVLGSGRAQLESAGNHSALLGLRYAFNPPPAPVVPVVAAPIAAPAVREIARTYLVFFDWNRADLTARARQIINEAAQNSRTSNTTRVEVAGHADRSGTPAYNLRLSQRRAEVVAAELVRDGVARGAIVTQAFGEGRPLVPTADGVREPQNRRVEIVLR